MSSTLKLAAVLTLIDRASPALRQIERNSRNLQSVLGSTRYAMDGLDQPLNPARMQQYANAVDRVEHNFAGATQEIREMGTALSHAIKLTATLQQQAEKVAGHFSKQRQSMRNDLTKGVMQLGVAGYAASIPLSAFAEAEDAAMTLKVSMMDSSGQVAKEFASINALATKLGTKLPGTNAEFQLMMANLVQQGISFQSILGGTGEAAGNLAVLLKMPFEDAAVFAAKMQDATKTSEKDMLSLMDTIQRTSYLGVDPSNMLGGFAKISAGMKIIKQQGLDGANAMAPLLVMADQSGMSDLSSAGNAYSKIFKAMLDQTKINKALKGTKLKLDFSNGKGEFGSFDNMFKQLERFKGMTTQARLPILSDIFGNDAENIQALNLLIDKGQAGYDETIKKMQRQADLQTRIEAQLGTLSNLWDQAKGATTNAMVSVVEALAPNIKIWVNQISEMAERFSNWAKANPKLIQTIGSLVLKLLMFKAAMFGIKYSFLLVFGTFFSMLAAFLKFGLIMLIINRISSRFGFGLLSRLKLMLHGVLLFGRAFMFLAAQSIPFVIGMLARLSVALFTTPIGWIVLLIAAAALMIYRYWEPIKAFFQGVWIGIKQGVAPLAASFDMLKTALAPLQPIWDGLVQILTVVGGVIGEMITPVQSSADTLNSASSAGQLFGQVLGGIISLIGQVVLGFITAFVTGIQMVGQALGTMAGMVQVYGSQIIEWFSNLGSRAAEIFSMIGQSILNGLTLPVRLAIDAINLLINGINRIPGISIPNIPSIPIAGATGTVAPVKAAALPPLKAAGAKQTITNHFAGSPITITGVTDPKAVGVEVQRQLVANQRQQESRQRSALTDTE